MRETTVLAPMIGNNTVLAAHGYHVYVTNDPFPVDAATLELVANESIDRVAYPALQEEQVYARSSDAALRWEARSLSEATRGATNGPDIDAPSGVFSYSNNAGLTKTDVTVTLTLNEPVRDIEGWDRQKANVFTRVFDANGKFDVTVTDIVGNTAVLAGEVRQIDRGLPVISGIGSGATAYTPVEIVVTDPDYQGYHGFDSGFGLQVNGVPVAMTQAADGTYRYTFSAEGTYSIVATDIAGNAATLAFVIAKAPGGTSNPDGNSGSSSGGQYQNPTGGGTNLPLLEIIQIVNLDSSKRSAGQSLSGSVSNVGVVTALDTDDARRSDGEGAPAIAALPDFFAGDTAATTDGSAQERQTVQHTSGVPLFLNIFFASVAIAAGLMALAGVLAARGDAEGFSSQLRIMAMGLAVAAVVAIAYSLNSTTPIGGNLVWTLLLIGLAGAQTVIITTLKSRTRAV